MFVAAKKAGPASGHGGPSDYQERKRKEAQRQQQMATAGRDIGRIPKPKNMRRRSRAKKDFLYFCKAYLGEIFVLPWSADHKTVAQKIKACVTLGALFAIAMPRGSGKTSLAEAAAIWAMLFHFRRFIVLIGSDETSAKERLDSIKITLETNDKLLEDFPEVCLPIRALERIANRCKGQLCQGKPTYITWTQNTLRLPTTPGNPPGAILTTCGITGRIRGLNYKLPSGETLRPDLCLIDDPQTDESAKSPAQTQQREKIIAGAILGLAGPGKKIAAIMPCTVICEGDLADRMLDREKHPEWQGERLKMVYQWSTHPEADELLTTYAKLRADDLAGGSDLSRATGFWKEHREVLEQGATVAWPERKNRDEYSGLQHAYNLRLTDPEAFAAEYQNEPLPADYNAELAQLKQHELERRTNGYGRRVLPPDATTLTAFIDVHDNAFYYMVAAWRTDFTGWVVDYGTWPDQRTRYFSLRGMRRTLARAYPNTQLSGRLFAGMKDLTAYLFSDIWDGYKLDMALVDANWGESTDTVYSFCRQCRHRIFPAHGQFIGAKSRPLNYGNPKGKVGLNWRMPPAKSKRETRYVLTDVNFWKNRVAEALLAAEGDPGAITFWNGDHRLFSEHLTSEYRVKVTARERTVYEWTQRPNSPDNHWWDGLVGCAVAANMCGVTPLDQAGQRTNKAGGRKKRKSRVSYL